MDCIFCKIVNKEAPADIVFENSKVIAFRDINPKAKIHILIIPKDHIASAKEINKENKDIVGELILAANDIAKEKEIKGYKLSINVGREGGQIIDHLHLHFLSGDCSQLP